MQRSLFDEQISEVMTSSNTAYILKNHDMFYDIGFRVMKNQKSGSIMECHQLKYNGNFKFVFFTDEYTRLSDLIAKADSDHVMVIISNLIRSIEDIESNGFLNVACIDNRLDHIFVDNRTMAVRLIYLPINIPMNGIKKAEFENDIRAQLIKLIQGLPNAESGKLSELVRVLMDGNNLSLSDVAKRLQVSPVAQHIMDTASTPNVIQQTRPTQQNSTPSSEQMTQQSYISIPISNNTTMATLVSATGKENVVVSKTHFLIGKSAEKVDGVISGNSAVSRVHCEVVIRENGQMSIIDKGSANGTFVNGQRIGTDQYVPLQENDRVKIANEEYIVRR
ncbi:MAG: FHA domain-containing protein [Agathobacter sp.]|nr:FHA domain-containing protein [Agathobacter sp.]